MNKDDVDQIVLNILLTHQLQGAGQQSQRDLLSQVALALYDSDDRKQEYKGFGEEQLIEFYVLWAVCALESLQRRGLSLGGYSSEYELDRNKISERYPTLAPRLFDMYPEVFE